MKDEVDNYFSYIRKNNKNYFKFKQFSQIKKIQDKLIDKLEGAIRVWFENMNRFPIGKKGERYDYEHITHIFACYLVDIFDSAETKTNFSCVNSKNP